MMLRMDYTVVRVIPISSNLDFTNGETFESVIIWSMSSRSEILLNPRRPNFVESARTIVF